MLDALYCPPNCPSNNQLNGLYFRKYFLNKIKTFSDNMLYLSLFPLPPLMITYIRFESISVGCKLINSLRRKPAE